MGQRHARCRAALQPLLEPCAALPPLCPALQPNTTIQIKLLKAGSNSGTVQICYGGEPYCSECGRGRLVTRTCLRLRACQSVSIDVVSQPSHLRTTCGIPPKAELESDYTPKRFLVRPMRGYVPGACLEMCDDCPVSDAAIAGAKHVFFNNNTCTPGPNNLWSFDIKYNDVSGQSTTAFDCRVSRLRGLSSASRGGSMPAPTAPSHTPLALPPSCPVQVEKNFGYLRLPASDMCIWVDKDLSSCTSLPCGVNAQANPMQRLVAAPCTNIQQMTGELSWRALAACWRHCSNRGQQAAGPCWQQR